MGRPDCKGRFLLVYLVCSGTTVKSRRLNHPFVGVEHIGNVFVTGVRDLLMCFWAEAGVGRCFWVRSPSCAAPPEEWTSPAARARADRKRHGTEDVVVPVLTMVRSLEPLNPNPMSWNCSIPVLTSDSSRQGLCDCRAMRVADGQRGRRSSLSLKVALLCFGTRGVSVSV